ncbi:phosphopantetheine-binding protein (plasmid) [Streptomyces sp. NBC_01216]|uniref:acyl carrier protein n=1 Tax=Streptomyces sp. NBC_01216 TaxID=2903778 RepID=UPI002E0F9DB2|nr:phosphopantetheine-binding protein [Streptomyces sp. NBC_01216]
MTRFDETISMVADAFAETLGTTDIDSETGFFDLGADSTTIVRFAFRLRKHWPDLRTVDVFSHPTVAELSAYLTMASPESPGKPLIRSSPADSRADLRADER